MNVKTIYLSGTIGSLTPTQEVLNRFNGAQQMLEQYGFKVCNPIRGKKIGDTKYDCNEAVHRDEHDIDGSNLVLAMFPSDTISIGTPMEIYRAREICKIPVIVVSPIEKIRNHYWIQSKATKIFATMEPAIEYIKEWYGDGVRPYFVLNGCSKGGGL